MLKHEIFDSYSPPPLPNYSINKKDSEFQQDLVTTRDQTLTQILLHFIMLAVLACLTFNHTSCPPEATRAVPVWAQVCYMNVNAVALAVCKSGLGQEHIFSGLKQFLL